MVTVTSLVAMATVLLLW